MTYDEFITEYHRVAARALQLSKKCRREGLLSAEEVLYLEKINQRDILEYGMRFAVDGTDSPVIIKILSNIIAQEDDKYTRLLMLIKKEAVLLIQDDYNPRMIAYILNSLTGLSLENDPIIQEIIKESDSTHAGEKDGGALSQDEINNLMGGAL